MPGKKFVFNEELWQSGVFVDCGFENGNIATKKAISLEGLNKAVYISSCLDSREKETIWGSMNLECKIHGDNYLLVSYFASDSHTVTIDDNDINLQQLIEDISCPIVDKLYVIDRLFSQPKKNIDNILLSDAKGRYLWFKLEMGYFGQNPICVSGMRISYPFVSIMRYLPAFYSADENNSDFLKRFLAIFQELLYDLQDNIDNSSRYFDTDYVEGDLLLWLSEWVAVDRPDMWQPDKLKTIIKESFKLYNKKGTKAGMEKIIELYTGETPLILEYFDIYDKIDTKLYNEFYRQYYEDDIYCFFVFINEKCLATPEALSDIKRLTNQYKPAHSHGKIIVLKQNMILGQYIYLGLNTRLSQNTQLELDNASALPFNSTILNKGEQYE